MRKSRIYFSFFIPWRKQTSIISTSCCKLKVIFVNFTYWVQNKSHGLSVWWCCSVMTDGFWAASSFALLCACVSCGEACVCVCVCVCGVCVCVCDSMMDGGLRCVSPALSSPYIRDWAFLTCCCLTHSHTLSHTHSHSHSHHTHTRASALRRASCVRFCHSNRVQNQHQTRNWQLAANLFCQDTISFGQFWDFMLFYFHAISSFRLVYRKHPKYTFKCWFDTLSVPIHIFKEFLSFSLLFLSIFWRLLLNIYLIYTSPKFI